MEGMNKKGVFTFTTLDDAKAIDGFLENADEVVVIGGGLIGVSAAEGLRKRGREVTVVEMKERVLNTILDDSASLIVEQTLKQAGVRIVTGHTVAEISGRERVKGVVLDNGERVPCEMVVVAIGVSPRAELASSAGVKVNRGVVVDRYMTTSHLDVYSCGDVAEAYDFVYETNRLTPIWPTAYIGGRTSGFNMAGVKTEYAGGTAMNALNYFGLDITSAGMVTPAEGNKYELITKQQNGVYKKVVLKDDLVTGMVFIGDIEKSGIVFNLMRDRVNVHDFKEKLLTDDFGLVSLPQDLRQEWLKMGGFEFSAFVPAAAEVEEVIAGE
jgi:NAD(P)H-nitrite reductase large subunit